MAYDSLINNNLVIIILAVIIASYAYMIRIDMPDYITKLFQNDIFRFVFLALLMIYSFNASPHVAITLALIFVITLYFLNNEESREHFDNEEDIIKSD